MKLQILIAAILLSATSAFADDNLVILERG